MTYQTTAHGNQPPREEDEARLRVVKPELPEGWRKSLTARAAGCGSEDALPPSGLNTVLEANHEVLQAAVPIMKEYEECFMRERGLLALLSPDGVLLHGTGDAALAESAGFRPGTVLPGTVRPEAVSEKGRGEDASARWGCWIEPLRGGKRRIMGFLALLLPRAACHAATPALLHAIAANINNQHHVHDLLSDQSAVLELLTDGVVILDRRGGKAANAHARRMLDIPGEENTSLGPISDFVRDGAPFMQILGQKRTVMDEEATLRVGNAQKRYILSASFIPEDKGVVCTLAETARMQKFAVRTAGSKAIYRFSDILGESDVIVNAVQLARVAAQSDITTLLLGESGTGKELFAHAIHNGSARKSGPFVVVNCGALPRDLVQSELFGYEAGAFTGAAKNGKPGKFELADGGTIFLDEIGEMPMEAQTNLLRLIQNKEVARVGGTTTKSVDVRIVAATNRNLSEAVARGTFRSDLFYRLSVLVINIPALRSRSSDIAALAAHFHGIRSGSSSGPAALFLARQYPRAGKHHRTGGECGQKLSHRRFRSAGFPVAATGNPARRPILSRRCLYGRQFVYAGMPGHHQYPEPLQRQYPSRRAGTRHRAQRPVRQADALRHRLREVPEQIQGAGAGYSSRSG